MVDSGTSSSNRLVIPRKLPANAMPVADAKDKKIRLGLVPMAAMRSLAGGMDDLVVGGGRLDDSSGCVFRVGGGGASSASIVGLSFIISFLGTTVTVSSTLSSLLLLPISFPAKRLLRRGLEEHGIQ